MSNTEVVKSGLFVEGIEVTSKHIGKELEVVVTDSDRWLPVGFVATLDSVARSGTLHIKDNSNDSWDFNLENVDEWGRFTFKWVDRTTVAPAKPVKMVSEQARSKTAKQLRDAWEILEQAKHDYDNILAKATAPNVGLKITESEVDEGNVLVVSYNAPEKFYN